MNEKKGKTLREFLHGNTRLLDFLITNKHKLIYAIEKLIGKLIVNMFPSGDFVACIFYDFSC